jgi:preprotein translocase subunit SecD
MAWCRRAPLRPTLLSSRLVRRLIPLLILVLGAFAVYIDIPGSRFMILSTPDEGFSQTLETKLGLDLKGGLQIKYMVPSQYSPTSGDMDVIRTIMENRINTTGAGEIIVQTVGTNQILVEVPDVKDPDSIRKLVGKTGQLEFVLLPRQDYGYVDVTTGQQVTGTKPVPTHGDKIDPELPAQFTGGQLDASKVMTVPDKLSGWAVQFGFKEPAKTEFGTWTGQNIGSYFAIVLDDEVVSAPYLKDAITSDTGVISGGFQGKADADALTTILRYGALPYPVEELDVREIPATLGQSFLTQTLFAGAVGILLVMLFMLIYYRLPGVIANLALVYYGLVVLAIFRVIPVTLTLAGIAGFVLSVGMAVDANILIFERTKEELRSGKTLIAATEAGFNRAWNSIFDSNVSSMITAAILYFFGTPTVRGFALVLMIGVATSMFSAITVSRTMLRGIVQQRFAERAWLFGVSNEEFQARALQGRYRREGRRYV